MKKVITILVLILAIAVSGFYIYLDFSNKKEDLEIVKKDEVKKEIVPIVNNKEVKLGNMIIDIPASLEIEELKDKNISINIIGKYVVDESINEVTDEKYKMISFFYRKNDNPNKTSLKEWSDYNGPQVEKNSHIPLDEKYIKINKLDAYLTLYGRPDYASDTKYYNREQTYLSNKTDIYEIRNYRQADEKEIKLTPEEEKSIQNYEKIVDEIIKSIRFVD